MDMDMPTRTRHDILTEQIIKYIETRSTMSKMFVWHMPRHSFIIEVFAQPRFPPIKYNYLKNFPVKHAEMLKSWGIDLYFDRRDSHC